MVATDACSWATCASIAMLMRSRNRRLSRSNTTWRCHSRVAEAASPNAATWTFVRASSRTPSTRSASHRPTSEEGRASARVITRDATSIRGSIR
jgi:hypothetical protein